MSNEEDDMDLFGDDPVVEAARHLRRCKECRKRLKEDAGPVAKFTLAEVEAELDRPLTSGEKRILAKSVSVIVSRLMAERVGMFISSLPPDEAIEQAIADGLLSNPFTNSPVGEA